MKRRQISKLQGDRVFIETATIILANYPDKTEKVREILKCGEKAGLSDFAHVALALYNSNSKSDFKNIYAGDTATPHCVNAINYHKDLTSSLG